MRIRVGPISWPIGKKSGTEQLIVYKGLATALLHEAAEAISDSWLVPLDTVKSWQATLKAAMEQPASGKKRDPLKPIGSQKRGKLGRRWSWSEDEVVRTLSPTEAARKLGVSRFVIDQRRKRLGVGLHDQGQARRG